MTQYSDNIYSGFNAATSAASSRSPVMLTNTFRFPVGVGSSTQTGTFPPNTNNLDAELYIIADGTAATTDRITVSAGGTTLLTFTSFGSASGVVRTTTAGLGTLTVTASACAIVAPPSGATNGGEIPFAVTLANTDAVCDYQVVLRFNRADTVM